MCMQREFADDPKGFMESNLILVPKEVNEAIIQHGLTLAEFYVEPKDSYFELQTMAGKINPGNPPRVMAYWCPYRKSGDGTVTLGNYADYMFTAKLDGCSFGVGTPTAGGEVFVCHSNRTDQTTEKARRKELSTPKQMMELQSTLQRKALKAVIKKPMTRLLETSIKEWATVLGVSAPWKAWAFYYQSYSGYTFNGLYPFRNTALDG